jgi:cell division protein FtsL
MGVEIKRNEKVYTNGISDESYHPEKNGLVKKSKKILLMKFGLIEKLLKLIIVFLVIIGLMIYMIIKNNTKREHLQWLNDNAYDDEGSKILDRFEGIKKTRY